MKTEEEINRAREVPLHIVLGLQQGRRTYIRCPFHSERSPSCLIYADHGYKCHGCGKQGNNAIDFLVEMGCTFNEAVEELQKY